MGPDHGSGKEVRHATDRSLRDPPDRGGDPELRLRHDAREQSVRGRPRVARQLGQESGLRRKEGPREDQESRRLAKLGTTLTVATSAGKREATVVKKPFVDPKKDIPKS